MSVIPQNVINGTEEGKIKTTKRGKGARVLIEKENALRLAISLI